MFPLKTSVRDPVCVARTCCRFYDDTVLSYNRFKAGKMQGKHFACVHMCLKGLELPSGDTILSGAA